MQKVLFVCLGNICRSPTAEAVLNKLIHEKNLQLQVLCESAGTSDYHIGESPDPRTIFHGKNRGYQFISKAQQFDPQTDFEKYDLIICLDKTNLQNIRKLDPQGLYHKKTKLLMEFARNISAAEVPDPYYCGAEVFEQVIDYCEDACLGLLLTLVPQRV